MKHKVFLHIATLLFIVLSYNTSTSQSCDLDGQFYSNFEDILNILDENNCSSCHSGEAKEGNWSYDTYKSLLTSGNCNSPIIVHGNASESYLYNRLTDADNLCGESDPNHKISNEELDQIESWINSGAPEYCMPFYKDIEKIFDTNGCQSCHNQNAPQSWHYETYAALIGEGTDSNCGSQNNIIDYDAAGSLLYDKINNDGSTACGNPMEGTNGPLTDKEIAHIRDWINGGTPETSATLPVILSAFECRSIGNQAQLEWETASEIATEKFIIERSNTGRNFISIGKVEASGVDGSSTTYSFTDNKPQLGENYYRLKIQDLDGSFDYSNIRVTTIKFAETGIIVSPNPARSSERLKVTWSSPIGQDQAYLEIVDTNGRSLHRKIIFDGTNYVRLPALIEGVYYVIIENYFGGFLLERVVIID